MLHIVEAGTDAALLLLFDPQSLPANFDTAHASGDSLEVLEQLDAEGRLLWIPMDGDGGYLLHAYVDQEPSAELRPYLQEPRSAQAFLVSSGEVYFAGAEYAFHNDDALLRRFPHMGSSFPVARGQYEVELFETNFPEGLVAGAFQRLATPAQKRLQQLFDWITATAVLSILALVLCLAFVPWRVWFTVLLPISLFCIVLSLLVRHARGYRQTHELRQAIEREFPPLIAVLRRKN